MDLELSGKVAVVTGASKGIGLAVARALAAEGAEVVAGARTVDTLDGLERVTALEVDLARPGGPEKLVGDAVERHGRVDVLVNNVGGVRLRLDGFLRDERRRLRGLAATQLLRCPAGDARGSRGDAPAGRGSDRERRLRQRLLPARRAGDRLRRGEGGVC